MFPLTQRKFQRHLKNLLLPLRTTPPDACRAKLSPHEAGLAWCALLLLLVVAIDKKPPSGCCCFHLILSSRRDNECDAGPGCSPSIRSPHDIHPFTSATDSHLRLLEQSLERSLWLQSPGLDARERRPSVQPSAMGRVAQPPPRGPCRAVFQT